MKTLRLSLLAGGLVLLARIGAADGAPEVRPLLVHGFSTAISDFRNGLVVQGSVFYGVSEHGGAFGYGTFFEVDANGTATVLASFGLPDSGARGRFPIGELVHDGGTYFYGVTNEGGRFGAGTVFRTTIAGAVETLVDLSGHDGAAPGFEPSAGLTLGADRNFYGMLGSGSSGRGRPGLFRVSPDGRYQFLFEFSISGDSGGGSRTNPLLARPDGTLVGVLPEGGAKENGTVFRVNADGTVTTLATFTGDGGTLPGANPTGRPIAAPDGTLYGVGESRNGTQQGNAGFIWKIDPAGTPSILVAFSFGFGSGPAHPLAPLAFATNGDLLVVCADTQSSGRGGVFRITPAGVVSTEALFDGSSGEAVLGYPQFGLALEFGTTFLTTTDDEIVRVPLPGSVDVITLATPDAGTGLGTIPNSPVVFTPGGTLHTLTRAGGANFRGTVIKQPPASAVSLLAPLPADSSNFREQFLALDPANNVLITDQYGGMNGNGRILQITPAGVLSTRASFTDTSEATGVIRPAEGLAHDGSGTFFGLAHSLTSGGDGPDALAAYRLSGSTITRINPGAGLPAIGTPDDSFSGPLVPVGDGLHYLGVLEGPGPGKVFRLGMGGNVVTFTNFGGSVGSNPVGPLLREPGGSFLVQATGGDDVVAIVRLSSTGKASKVGQVSVHQADEHILAPLAQDTQGRIYGAVESGGANGTGLLYRTDTDGTTRVLFEFPVTLPAINAGTTPSAGLTFNSAAGAIYGVTEAGGPNGGGTIFKIFTTPQATGGTQPASGIAAHIATLSGNLTNNGYNVEYWFTFGTDSLNLDNESAHLFTGGFHGTEPLSQVITGLKGHRTYVAQFNAKVGFGADAVVVNGGQVVFTTPNGAPVALNDTILVTATTGDFPGEVLDNDVDLDDDAIEIQGFTQGTYGGVAQVGGTLVYTPTQAFFDNGGRDTFTYTIKDDQTPALTAMATVDVLSDIAITGEYAGLIFDDPDGSLIPRELALIPSPDQIAAGFAQFALSRGRRFSARFQVGARSVSVKGTMAANRGTRIASGRSFGGAVRTTPAGIEARIAFNGRTLIMRAGQAFAAVPGAAPRPKSDFTMRFDPTEFSDPTSASGLPAGSGFAVVRQGANARATLVGALPDGSTFSAKSVVDPDGKMPFRALLAKGKGGTFDGELIVDTMAGTIEPAPGTTARWEKPAQSKSRRFPGGFGTKMMPFGGRHTVPAKNTPPLDLMGGQLVATFDRGGLFAMLSSRFTFTGAKAVVVAGSDDAKATTKLDGRTGLVSGNFKPAKKAVKYRGVLVLRDKTVAGFFLGTTDAGSVGMVVAP
ncbi:MAG: choice-of-anchor tandem repeat GloVer-containing protein [Chthoniobacteraceae bacterium]